MPTTKAVQYLLRKFDNNHSRHNIHVWERVYGLGGVFIIVYSTEFNTVLAKYSVMIILWLTVYSYQYYIHDLRHIINSFSFISATAALQCIYDQRDLFHQRRNQTN